MSAPSLRITSDKSCENCGERTLTLDGFTYPHQCLNSSNATGFHFGDQVTAGGLPGIVVGLTPQHATVYHRRGFVERHYVWAQVERVEAAS